MIDVASQSIDLQQCHFVVKTPKITVQLLTSPADIRSGGTVQMLCTAEGRLFCSEDAEWLK